MWFGDDDLIFRFYELICQKQKIDFELDLKDILRKLIIGERDFYRQIKRITGTTPNHFINILRFFGAKEMLLFDYSLDEIMFRIKVDSESYFYNRFKEFYNNTPLRYKQKIRARQSIYYKLSLGRNPDLFMKYIEMSKLSSRKYYRKLLAKRVADFISSDKAHDIWINTYLSEVQDRHKNLFILI